MHIHVENSGTAEEKLFLDIVGPLTHQAVQKN